MIKHMLADNMSVSISDIATFFTLRRLMSVELGSPAFLTSLVRHGRVMELFRKRHTPRAKSFFSGWLESPKAEALGHLDATARATAMQEGDFLQRAAAERSKIAGKSCCSEDSDGEMPVSFARTLQNQPRSLHTVATRVTPADGFARLDLGQSELDGLRAIFDRVSAGSQLMRAAPRSAKHSGTVALFTGGNRGQRSAATEALAHELHLPLYRVDLGRLTSRYIGSTEMHLAQIFNSAGRAGAILLFDEADALFGKRTHVSDSHHKYADNGVSLTPSMEQYCGLVVIAADSSSDVDPKLLKRVRHHVAFPKRH